MASVTALVRVAGLLLEMLEARLAEPGGAGASSPARGSRDEAAAALRQAADGALDGFDLAGPGRTLAGFGRAADLDALDVHVLATAILPSLDDRIGRAVGLLHDDVSRTRPSVGLTARLLARMGPRELAMESAGPEGAPAHRGLLGLAGAYGDPEAALANRELVVHPRLVAAVLFGGPLPGPDPRLEQALQLEDPGEDEPGEPETGEPEPGARGGGSADQKGAARGGGGDEPESAEAPGGEGGSGADDGGILQRLVRHPPGERTPGVLSVGADLEATLELARDFARGQDVRVLRVDVEMALAAGETLESLPRVVRRESILLRALPVWAGLPDRDALASPLLARRLARMLEVAPSPLLVHASHPWTPPADVPLTLIQIPEPTPTFEERVAAWAAEGDGLAASAETAELLATSFSLPRSAVMAARSEAALGGTVLGGRERDRLERAAHRQAASRLVRFARKVTPRAGWADLVVPESVREQLREIEWRVAHRGRIFEASGFDRTAAGRRGFLTLFVGASGTGKTLAAEIIAGARGFDLYKVDVAALVSKYIGDTEKHLAQVFDDAEATRSILFFDEADSVFGKRSEVRDSHDRYANLEINYLLQRVEAFDGVVILATNMRQNMDEAFLRRLDMVVELPFPEDEARHEIWRRVWPGSVRLADDVDLSELALRFRLSGGSIRNVAVDAAFRAVGRGADPAAIRIERDDLVVALGREYQKLGRPVTRAEFGRDHERIVELLFAGPRPAESAPGVPPVLQGPAGSPSGAGVG